MKTCPNCGELLGDNVSICFKCRWNFDDPTENEKAAEKERIRREKEAKEEAERKRRLEEENRQKKLQEVEEIMKREKLIFSLNDLYEYKIEKLMDVNDGTTNTVKMELILNAYAKEGWRLYKVYTNEIGKTQRPQVLSIGTINATIDETILIFERRISRHLEEAQEV